MLLRSYGDLHFKSFKYTLNQLLLVTKIETHPIVSDSEIGIGAKVLGISPYVFCSTTRG
jgi:hypothetical protein